MSERELVKSPAPPPARQPKHRALPGTTDTHFHIFESAKTYPLSPHRIYDPPLSSVENYRAMASTVGIERMVVVQASAYGTDNRCLLDSIDNAYDWLSATDIKRVFVDNPAGLYGFA